MSFCLVLPGGRTRRLVFLISPIYALPIARPLLVAAVGSSHRLVIETDSGTGHGLGASRAVSSGEVAGHGALRPCRRGGQRTQRRPRKEYSFQKRLWQKMERAAAPGVETAAETSADCLFPSPALPGSGSMGIISADVVHNISTPKHGVKVIPWAATEKKASYLASRPATFACRFVECQLI